MPQKYIVGIHTNSLVIDPRTEKPFVTHIRAKSNCKRCYGRGFEGWYNEGGNKIKVYMCACFAKKVAHYADKHGLKLSDIKTELFVEEEKSNQKIKVVGSFDGNLETI